MVDIANLDIDIQIPERKKKLFDNGHWHFDKQMGTGKHSGFIYVIRDNYLKRFYLGKKFYKINNKRSAAFKSDSNWRTYISSSSTVKILLDNRPLDEFDFIVVEEYEKRGAVSYAETWTLCNVEAPTSVTWYNKRIEEVAWNVNENITDKHKLRLNRIISMEPFNEIYG